MATSYEAADPGRHLVPPPDGWAAEDLDRLRGLPRHTELIDGVLVFRSPQRKFHARTLWLLENSLLKHAPDDLDVFREFSVILDRRNRPEPDAVVVPLAADPGPDGTFLRAEDVVLAVEVVSPDSEARDRETKPKKYAAAGIVHFWRVEQGPDGLPVVYVYELDPALKAYTPTGIHHNALKLDVPFPLSIDLTAINQRRP
ncbi:Uma2 family endonuclease [Streptomyces microflavus]|uniref:Uma2 family endonuclease n=1 Tax=Streptomyces microflavus TaxID=1919 RepID=UPI00369BCC85